MVSRMRRIAVLSRLAPLSCYCAVAVIAAVVIFPRLDTRPRPHADSLGYFVYLPALFEGRPFDLTELEAFGRYSQVPGAVKGRRVNVFCVGSAIAWLPWYAVVRLFRPQQKPCRASGARWINIRQRGGPPAPPRLRSCVSTRPYWGTECLGLRPFPGEWC